MSRGHERRYYICRKCRILSVPADDAERIVVEAIQMMTLRGQVRPRTDSGPQSRSVLDYYLDVG